MNSENIEIKNLIRNIEPLKLGNNHSTKIAVNVGVSPNQNSIEDELKKSKIAVEYGANVIADHTITSSEDVDKILNLLIEQTTVPISTVPIYQVAVEARETKGAIIKFKPKDIVRVIEHQAKLGVDIMTLHSSVTKKLLELAGVTKRLIEITSRGGVFIAAYMTQEQQENPFLVCFDEILDILKSYNIVLSLGTTFRPATITNEIDDLIKGEIDEHCKLTHIALEKGVRVIAEYGGHVKLNMIPGLISHVKDKCYNVPVRPLITCTDVAAGWDHLSSAIASTVAAINGADLLTIITRAEHLGLPREEDIIEAVISFKIAAHIADTVKLNDLENDYNISQARKAREWDKIFKYSIDPLSAEKLYRKLNKKEKIDHCSMCGDLCAHKIYDDLVNNNSRK